MENDRGRPSALLVVADESAVLVEARSSVGLISFGTLVVTGHFRGVVVGNEIAVEHGVDASLVLPVASLVSGNSLHDAEMHRRLNAQRYPTITAELSTAEALGDGNYAVTGDLTIRGTTHRETGTVQVSVTQPRPAWGEDPAVSAAVLVASGTLVIDMRHFGVELPHILRMRVYPEVSVSFRVTVGSSARVARR